MENKFSAKANLFTIYDRQKLIKFLKNGTYVACHQANSTRSGNELYIPFLLDTMHNRKVSCVFPIPKDLTVEMVTKTFEEKETSMIEVSGSEIAAFLADMKEIQSFFIDDLCKMKEAMLSMGNCEVNELCGDVMRIQPFKKKNPEGIMMPQLTSVEEDQLHAFKFAMSYFIPPDEKKKKDFYTIGVSSAMYFPQYEASRPATKKRKLNGEVKKSEVAEDKKESS